MTSPWQFSGMSVVRLLLVLLLLVPAAPLMAMDDALLGRWAYAGGSCEEDMTIKIAKDGVSGTEYFCATKRIKRNKGGWTIDFSCSSEDNSHAYRAHWRLLKNGQLREVVEGKTTHYERCSGPDEVLLDPTNPYTAPSRCVACFNNAMSIGRSVGGYCPSACAQVFDDLACDPDGTNCRLPD